MFLLQHTKFFQIFQYKFQKFSSFRKFEKVCVLKRKHSPRIVLDDVGPLNKNPFGLKELVEFANVTTNLHLTLVKTLIWTIRLVLKSLGIIEILKIHQNYSSGQKSLAKEKITVSVKM
jgi:hypothetical protein